MSAAKLARALVDRLSSRGYGAAEVLTKQGRTRRSELSAQGPVSVLTVESGWAVRAGGSDGSFFCCGTGAPPAGGSWPEPTGVPLRLPEPKDGPQGGGGSERDVALMVEGEAKGLVAGIARELGRQLEGARLLRAVLDDGSSDTHLVSSQGISVSFRSRLATLYLEAVWRSDATTRTVLQLTEREASSFQPRALARRLADVLTVRAGHPGPERDRGEIVLGPVVGARLLAALTPLWVGPKAGARAATLADRQDRLGSSALNVVDDGGLSGGALAAPVDGEGLPTRRLVLVREGRFQQPLLDWRQAEPPSSRAVGCVRRPSWRDRPSLGLSHLFIEGDENLAASDLLAAVARGYYLLDTLGAVRLDFASDRFAVPVCGFSLAQGQARDTVARSWLCGGIGALLHGIRAAARDLSFVPAAGMVGAPTLLTNGLELRREL